MTNRWTDDALSAFGIETQASCSETDLAAAQNELGPALPEALRELLGWSNGLFDQAGQWFVVWPLDRIVAETKALVQSAGFPRNTVAFGDDGTGNPFCVSSARPHEVSVRYPIASERRVLATGIDSFLEDWLHGNITT